jgi:Glycosyl transferases group 1
MSLCAAARPGSSHPVIVAFATQGHDGHDEARLRSLLEKFQVELLPFDRSEKARSMLFLLKAIRRSHPDLAVMEGSGIAGGLAMVLARLAFGTRYVVSSGDAIRPFVAARVPMLGPLFGLYERLLYRYSVGYIGWTPYLTGRALTLGAPRGVSAPGWAPVTYTDDYLAASRARVRTELGISPNALVAGIVGSLTWNEAVGYCYGYELVQALRYCDRPDVRALIVGGGSGLPQLRQLAASLPRDKVVLTGPVPRAKIPEYLAAMEVASLPQSVDGVGNFRYSTKLSEYMAAGLPVITGQIPFAYDLDEGWLWRVPGAAPWDPRYVKTLAGVLSGMSSADIAAKSRAVPRHAPEFDRERQVNRVTAFVNELLADRCA